MLADYGRPEGMLDDWSLAMVLDARAERVEIGLADGARPARWRAESLAAAA